SRVAAGRGTGVAAAGVTGSGSSAGRGRGRAGVGGVRRAESEEGTRPSRAAKIQTPPPPYEVAQSQSYYQLPPSYEEALANSLSRVRVSPPPSQQPPAPPPPSVTPPRGPILPPSVTSTAALLPVGILTSRPSRVLEEQAAVLEAQREAQRQARREAQLEQERDMERQRIRELQLAQYCGCAKCQNLYYSYYYDDPMNDGGAFPMETQVLMQEVLTDGLAFCSLM
ncbi:pre-mRNA 3'-end-processing factor FIP1-like, partial [Eriocheir sinensis]|uniref:pre-mRNA 3'-end-processing factor FIP1-like n=1 Tax=Eriocheir sinensis TaxID=95602 RepID=UPI0021C811B0